MNHARRKIFARQVIGFSETAESITTIDIRRNRRYLLRNEISDSVWNNRTTRKKISTYDSRKFHRTFPRDLFPWWLSSSHKSWSSRTLRKFDREGASCSVCRTKKINAFVDSRETNVIFVTEQSGVHKLTRHQYVDH